VSQIAVFVVDDHEMVLDALVVAIGSEPGLRVVGQCTSVGDFCAIAAAVAQGSSDDSLLEVDVVVADLELRGEPGTSTVVPAREAFGANVLLISGAGDRRAVSAAVESGCAGFVSKGLPLAELAEAIRTVANGGVVYPAGLLREALDPQASRPATSLTDRERTVLAMLAGGRSVGDIAAELSVSIHTTRNHVRAILTKLDARSQLEAVVIAVRQGLVTIA
jgi:DNA-binding NarL/FixJ family response regulator